MRRAASRFLRVALALTLMTAVAVALTGCAGAGDRGDRSPVRYTCPMHPQVVQDGPGDCPICGMRLVPADRGGADPEIPTGIEPRASVELDDRGLQLAGVRTAPVRKGRIDVALRAAGTVVPDETRIRHVHTKVAGWVEKLFVNFTGQAVRAGAPLLAIYSPELLASQEEYLRALDTVARLSDSSLPEVRRSAEELRAAARRRLALLDVPEAEIEELAARRESRRLITLPSPVSGYVTVKNVAEGHRVEPGMELFQVTDLSRVWIEANLFEADIPRVRLGQRATVDLPFDPSRHLEGRVVFISPTLEPATRTLPVRLEFPNPSLVLRPGMFAQVDLDVAAVEGLVIPDSAVLDTGREQVVFVRSVDATFVPRSVVLGARAGAEVQVVRGLWEGEEVAVQANFLLDSESRLRAAFAGTAPAPSPPHQEHSP